MLHKPEGPRALGPRQPLITRSDMFSYSVNFCSILSSGLNGTNYTDFSRKPKGRTAMYR